MKNKFLSLIAASLMLGAASHIKAMDSDSDLVQHGDSISFNIDASKQVERTDKPAKKIKLLDDMFNLPDPTSWTSNPSRTTTAQADKPYKCEFSGCNKSFSGRSGVFIHTNREHTQENMHLCHFCALVPKIVKKKLLIGKAYFDINFPKHLRSHTQPYICGNDGQCTERFTRKSQLAEHQTKEHGVTNNDAVRGNNKTFPCRLCGKEGLTDLPSHKAECRSLLEYVLLTKYKIPASEDNLKKIGFSDDRYLSASKKQTGITHRITLNGYEAVTSPMQTSNDDRITNAHDDPSHQLLFETPLIQPTAKRIKSNAAPEPFGYYVRKNNQYETE
jgi:hypothetical protein